MANTDLRGVTLKVYDDFGSGNIVGLLAIIDENARWVTHGFPEIHIHGDVRGHAKIEELFGNIGELLEVRQNHPDFLLIDGNRVLARGTLDATAIRTGRNFKSSFADILDFRDGKVVQYERFMDTHKMFQALY